MEMVVNASCFMLLLLPALVFHGFFFFLTVIPLRFPQGKKQKMVKR